MDACLLGLDIGTSSCKAALFAPDGRTLSDASVPYAVSYPKPGWAEQEPVLWRDAAFAAIRQVLEKSGIAAEAVAGVGVDGQSWAMVALGGDGQPLLPSPIWTDRRAAEVCPEIEKVVGRERLFAVSGNPVMPGYTLPKVLWMKEKLPEVYAATDMILQSNSYIVYCLTGVMTQEPSQGYGWHCFNAEKSAWDLEIAGELGLRASLLPEIVPCSAVVGRVTEAAAKVTGLAAGTPVVAGGLDAACATLGVGVVSAGQTQEQGGQAGGMSLCLETYRAHPDLILSPHVLPGRWLLQGGTTGGGGALRWAREELCPELSFKEMDALAAQSPPGANGVRFLPFMAGERSPLWNPDAQALFYGLGFAARRSDMLRAVMEGVAFSLRHNLETAASVGAVADTLRATGGAAKSALWMQIKADVTGHPLEVPESDNATAFGAAILAGLGTGVYANEKDAVKSLRVAAVTKPQEENRAVYEAAYREYRRLIDALEPVFPGKKGATP